MERSLSGLSVKCLLPFVCALWVCAFGAQNSDWVLTNVNVVDLERGRIVAGRSIRVRDDRILAIEAAVQDGRTAGQTAIDGQGSFVIPGLFDMHVHLGLTTGVVSDASLSSHLQQGVLGVRDLGFPIDSLSVISKLASGTSPEGASAPRIWFVGPILNAPSTTSAPQIVQVSDRPGITSIVEQVAAGGGMAVKIHDRLSRAAYADVAAAARTHGLSVVGHIPALVPIDDVIKERQRSVEHLGGTTHGLLMSCSRDRNARERAAAALVPNDFFRLPRVTMSAAHLTSLLDGFDATQCAGVARRLSEAGSWQVPNLVLWRIWATTGADYPETPSAEDVAARARLYRTMLNLTRILHRENVPIMAGTDNIAPIHDELELLVDAGLSALDALRAATVQPAKFLDVDGSSGLVKPGFHADLALLKGNPLLDIRNTRQVASIILRGKYSQVTSAGSVR
jgi:imidazolonepropionase-like amidohydrolase